MYTLNNRDKFNIKHLVLMKQPDIAYDKLEYFLLDLFTKDNLTIVDRIGKILQAYESEFSLYKTPDELNCIEYCRGLIDRLLDEDLDVVFEDLPELHDIHPEIRAHITGLFKDWHYANAIEEAYKITRKRLILFTWKEKANEAFSADNYKFIFSESSKSDAQKDFQEWIKFLHMAIQNFRNEKAHTPAHEIDKHMAMHYIYLASLSLYLLPDKKLNP